MIPSEVAGHRNGGQCVEDIGSGVWLGGGRGLKELLGKKIPDFRMVVGRKSRKESKHLFAIN